MSVAAEHPSLRVVGPGRAGGALSLALARRGWQVLEPFGRDDDPAAAVAGADVVALATPDTSVATVAAAIAPDPEVLVVHLAGSLGVDVLAGHARRAALHPLVALPSPEVGAERLAGAWFALAGDPAAQRIVEDLGGRSFTVADEDRAAYHAAACIASNHLVALLGQVERVSAELGVPLEAYIDLVRSTVENVAALGPAAALTGPAARGDHATLERHRAALPAEEVAAYDALVEAALRLGRRPGPGSAGG